MEPYLVELLALEREHAWELDKERELVVLWGGEKDAAKALMWAVETEVWSAPTLATARVEKLGEEKEEELEAGMDLARAAQRATETDSWMGEKSA
jgi:hypothetical protein